MFALPRFRGRNGVPQLSAAGGVPFIPPSPTKSTEVLKFPLQLKYGLLTLQLVAVLVHHGPLLTSGHWSMRGRLPGNGLSTDRCFSANDKETREITLAHLLDATPTDVSYLVYSASSPDDSLDAGLASGLLDEEDESEADSASVTVHSEPETEEEVDDAEPEPVLRVGADRGRPDPDWALPDEEQGESGAVPQVTTTASEPAKEDASVKPSVILASPEYGPRRRPLDLPKVPLRLEPNVTLESADCGLQQPTELRAACAAAATSLHAQLEPTGTLAARASQFVVPQAMDDAMPMDLEPLAEELDGPLEQESHLRMPPGRKKKHLRPASSLQEVLAELRSTKRKNLAQDALRHIGIPPGKNYGSAYFDKIEQAISNPAHAAELAKFFEVTP